MSKQLLYQRRRQTFSILIEQAQDCYLLGKLRISTCSVSVLLSFFARSSHFCVVRRNLSRRFSNLFRRMSKIDFCFVLTVQAVITVISIQADAFSPGKSYWISIPRFIYGFRQSWQRIKKIMCFHLTVLFNWIYWTVLHTIPTSSIHKFYNKR